MEQEQKSTYKFPNAVIYTIRSPNTDKYYIGSTIHSMSKRFSQHKTSFASGRNSTESSCRIFACGNPYYELLENFPCNARAELQKRENELIRLNIDQVVNQMGTGHRRKIYHIRDKELKRLAEIQSQKETPNE
jgi:hypothetical protein